MKDEYDFSKGKRVKDIPALARLQAEAEAGKDRITIRLDREILTWFREQVNKAGGGNYQTLINDALKAHIQDKEGSLARTLRRILREELRRAS